MNEFRRGACPSLAAPMETGDGLLVRLMPPDGGWMLHDVMTLVRASMAYGSGMIEVTSRGSLQIRGLKPATVDLFSHTIGDRAAPDLGVLLHIPPFAHDETRALARAFRQGLAEEPVEGLAPKTSIVIDDAGDFHLAGLHADLRAVRDGGEWRLVVADQPLPVSVTTARVPIALHRMLSGLAQHAPGKRASELLARQGNRPFMQALGDVVHPARNPFVRLPDPDPVGIHAAGRRQSIVGLGLPFGQIDGSALGALVQEAQRYGVRRIWPAPGRALLLGELPAPAAPKLAMAGNVLGFIAKPDDPRRRISACAGAPYCAAGRIATRALAADLAALAAKFSPESLHVSGCAKGCAHPGRAALTLVGQRGGIGVIWNGTAQDEPAEIIDAGAVSGWFAATQTLAVQDETR